MIIRKNWIIIIFLIITAGVRLPGLFSRAIWYDEAITMLETAGNAEPSWPKEPGPARIAQYNFVGAPPLNKITEDLYKTDIHPPVYFWLLSLWRRWLGYSLETARFFSLICSLGSVLSLYLLLKIGKFKHPIIPSLIFALSSGAIYAGHEARSYALATFLLGLSALFSYISVEINGRGFRHLVYLICMVISCGLAFQTNYLALFPAIIILIWFLVYYWPVSKIGAILTILSTLTIWLIGFRFFLVQLSARPDQASGFVGILPEIMDIIETNAKVIWKSTTTLYVFKYVLPLLIIILLSNSVFYILFHWSEINQKLLLLFIGLALAPAMGILLLDILFNKHLAGYAVRYFLFSGPALAVLLTYGITQKRLTFFLLIILICIQFIFINWGYEISPGFPGNNFRSLAKSIKNNASDSQIVVIGAGYGRGFPGSVVYELDPKTTIAVLESNSNLERLFSSIQRYDDVWIIPSFEETTVEIENEVASQIKQSGYYNNMSDQESFIHFWR